MTDDDGQKTAALMMAMNGLRSRDIAEALNVSERQVLDWLTPSKPDDHEPPEAA